jgi:hypothetical protein
MIGSNQLTLVKQGSTWVITSTTPQQPLMTHLGQHLVKIGQNLVQPLTLLCHSRTFAALSKFHLNTSNSPNIKVVQFVEGHNFHVEWHLRFELQICEKAWSTPSATIHRHLENLHLGMQFVYNWLRKTPYGLCRSCRGYYDLQLSYSSLGPPLLQNLEKNCGQ